jgi:hypothetical protein
VCVFDILFVFDIRRVERVERVEPGAAMTSACLLAVVLCLNAADEPAKEPRKPNPFAPSLPLLTREEEQELDRIIDRFMQYDIGRLNGEEGMKALKEFEKLGPEATFALIRGLNKAAEIEHTCPALVISKKLMKILMASNDEQLLEFAVDNIGAGVSSRSRHLSALQNLRFQAQMRKNAVARSSPPKPPPGTPRALSTAELVKTTSVERDPAKLKPVLTELAERRGDEVLSGLTTAANTSDADIQKVSRDLLDKHLSRQTATFVREKLKDSRLEVRLAAIRVATVRVSPLTGDVIGLLSDENSEVREAAHQALVRLNRGQDLGPSANADDAERERAQKDWRAWWLRPNRP